jgi:hypothetical protein
LSCFYHFQLLWKEFPDPLWQNWMIQNYFCVPNPSSFSNNRNVIAAGHSRILTSEALLVLGVTSHARPWAVAARIGTPHSRPPDSGRPPAIQHRASERCVRMTLQIDEANAVPFSVQRTPVNWNRLPEIWCYVSVIFSLNVESLKPYVVSVSHSFVTPYIRQLLRNFCSFPPSTFFLFFVACFLLFCVFFRIQKGKS